MLYFDYLTGEVINKKVYRIRPKVLYSKSRYRRSLLTNWRNRLYLDSVVCPATFLTLTYAPEHLTMDKEEQRKDLQRFFKRLRRRLEYHDGDYIRFVDKRGRNQYFECKNVKLRYFLTKEIGTQGTQRAHFHCILFGVPFSIAFGEFLESAWNKGITYLEPCNAKLINYTTKYILKKYDTDDFFSLKSNGIGREWYEKSPRERGYIRKTGKPIIHVCGREIWLPRYFKQDKYFGFFTRCEFNKYIEDNMKRQLTGKPDTWIHLGGGYCVQIPRKIAQEYEKLSHDDIILSNLNKKP